MNYIELIQQARELCEKAETEFWYVKDSRWHCGKPILTQLCDALEVETARAEKAEAENRWIPVSEKLPEYGGNYLVCHNCKSGKQVLMRRFYETCPSAFLADKTITHWMPLPAPPKGE